MAEMFNKLGVKSEPRSITTVECSYLPFRKSNAVRKLSTFISLLIEKFE